MNSVDFGVNVLSVYRSVLQIKRDVMISLTAPHGALGASRRLSATSRCTVLGAMTSAVPTARNKL